MADVIIYYKKELNERPDWKEIVRIATDYDYMGVCDGGDFCVMIGGKDVENFCNDAKKLDYVERVELRKY